MLCTVHFYGNKGVDIGGNNDNCRPNYYASIILSIIGS